MLSKIHRLLSRAVLFFRKWITRLCLGKKKDEEKVCDVEKIRPPMVLLMKH